MGLLGAGAQARRSVRRRPDQPSESCTRRRRRSASTSRIRARWLSRRTSARPTRRSSASSRPSVSRTCRPTGSASASARSRRSSKCYGKENAYQGDAYRARRAARRSRAGTTSRGSANYAMPFDFIAFGAAVTPRAVVFAVLADVSLQLGASCPRDVPVVGGVQRGGDPAADAPLQPGRRDTPGAGVSRPARRLRQPVGRGSRRPAPANYLEAGLLRPHRRGGPGPPLLKEFKVGARDGRRLLRVVDGQATPIGVAGTTAAISSTAIGVLLTTGYAF